MRWKVFIINRCRTKQSSAPRTREIGVRPIKVQIKIEAIVLDLRLFSVVTQVVMKVLEQVTNGNVGERPVTNYHQLTPQHSERKSLEQQ